MSFPRRHAKLVRTVFVAMFVLVMASTATTHWFGLEVIKARDQTRLHRVAIGRLEQFLSMAKDAETGARGFVITGDESFLDPYRKALEELPADAAALRESSANLGAGRLDELDRLTATKLKELERQIAARRAGGLAGAQAVVMEREGNEAMGAIRSVVGRLVAEQEQRFAAAERLASRATTIRTSVFVAAGLLMSAFMAWAFGRIMDAVRKQDAALADAHLHKDQLEAQRRLLQVTLSSIGDCVIVTDDQGAITFLNPIAETTTGWTAAEAVGRDVSEVFAIINEDTRQPVASPVAKVLKDGVIVGLANHTLLIRKDGSEMPIDDSGAPIRDEHGRVHGVVLVFRDFSAQKAAENELRVAKEAAEVASKAKDQFLAMLSHELRTPLTPVLATLELWTASDEVPGTMMEGVQMIRRNVELEARIIDDLLDLTKVARGLLNIDSADTDVHEMLEFVAGMCRSQMYRKELRLTMQLDAGRHYIHTDPSRFQQVVWNIMRNASKFTEAGGEVRVRTCNDEAGNIRIAIADTGIGMTPATIERLFVPFDQGPEGTGRKYGGLGLGLAISHGLVELLGGTIAAESGGPGQGSTFTLSFPAFAAPAARPKKEAATPATRRLLKILLIEDHHDTATALSRLLQRRGHSAAAVHSLAAGLQAIRETAFDLVLCDLGLPDGTGMDFVTELRKQDSTPVLALSGFGTEEDVARALAAGFNGHLTKPVNFQKLETLIWQVLSQRG